MPNTGTKGFPLLSGLGAIVEQMSKSFHPKKVRTKKKLQKKHPFTVFNKIPELKGVSFG
jgi:hypothetical protein